jgi:uncharacterized protein (UPF0276 family)
MLKDIRSDLSAAPELPGPLGVGFGCSLAVPAALYTADLLDFVELTPEMLCHECRDSEQVRLVLERDLLESVQRRCGSLPMAIHGVELSIGSAHGMYEPCLEMLARLQKEWPFLWYSEHLNFQTILDSDGLLANTGVPLPLPLTQETVALVVQRSASIQCRFGVPFLLENPVHYLADLPADPDIADEFGLMDRITAQAGCGQLLDLHNLHCNAINFGFDAIAALNKIRMDAIGELHVAGGSWSDGFYTDAHDSRVPEPVWDLLELTLARAPRVSGVVFELLEEHIGRLGPDGIARELERARTIWRRYRPSG